MPTPSEEFQFGQRFLTAIYLETDLSSHGDHLRIGKRIRDGPIPLPFTPYPFDPIARSEVYFIVSPTGSGPLIAAVAISGYCIAFLLI